jgi:hypothetical protein
VPEPVVFALAMAVHLASGFDTLPILGALRRCIQPGVWGSLKLAAAHPVGGRSIGAEPLFRRLFPQCGGSKPRLPSNNIFLRFTVFLYWENADQLHMRLMEYWPYYMAGPWLVARVLRSAKLAPHDAQRQLVLRCPPNSEHQTIMGALLRNVDGPAFDLTLSSPFASSCWALWHAAWPSSCVT